MTRLVTKLWNAIFPRPPYCEYCMADAIKEGTAMADECRHMENEK